MKVYVQPVTGKRIEAKEANHALFKPGRPSSGLMWWRGGGRTTNLVDRPACRLTAV